MQKAGNGRLRSENKSGYGLQRIKTSNHHKPHGIEKKAQR